MRERKITLKLELNVGSNELADLVIKSLSPDNINLPEGIELALEKKSGYVIIIVRGLFDKLLTIKNTVEDIILSLTPLYNQLIRTVENESNYNQ